jgi:hypothetical protein
VQEIGRPTSGSLALMHRTTTVLTASDLATELAGEQTQTSRSVQYHRHASIVTGKCLSNHLAEIGRVEARARIVTSPVEGLDHGPVGARVCSLEFRRLTVAGED